MKHPKTSANYEFQIVNDKLVVSPVRYRGLNKLYQLNLSRMLIKCPQSPFPKKEIHVENPQQLMIISTAHNPSMRESSDLGDLKFSTDIKNKLNFKTKKNYLKKTIEQNKHNLQIRSEAGKNSADKNRIALKSEILNQLKNSEPLNTNLVQIYISQKKMHQSSFQTSQRKKSYLKRDNISTVKKTTNVNLIKPRKKPTSKMILPDLKSPQKKIQTLKSTIPMLTRDPEQLRNVRAECYAILQYPDNTLIVSHRGNHTYQIASLTKIMTFYCVQTLAAKNSIDISRQQVTVGNYIMDITGTSAQLLGGQIYTIQQLLYGLMLPSGNDSATCLAEWGGNLLMPSQDDSKMKIKSFINEMNKISKQLGLSNTRFGNPHGLPHPDSKSTAIQVTRLCTLCLNDPTFLKIVKTQQYSCTVASQMGSKREVIWQNTNKLLRRQGFIGIKTGITVTAGPCLATAYEFRDKIFIVSILRATKISRRFKQTRKLLYWALQKIYKNSLTIEEGKRLFSLKRNKPDLDSDYSEDEQQFNYDQSSQAEFKKRCNIISYQM